MTALEASKEAMLREHLKKMQAADPKALLRRCLEPVAKRKTRAV